MRLRELAPVASGVFAGLTYIIATKVSMMAALPFAVATLAAAARNTYTVFGPSGLPATIIRVIRYLKEGVL